MSIERQIDELLAQRASQWVDLLKDGDGGHYAAFVDWVAESPRNLNEFLTIAALDQELADKDVFAGIDRAALLRQVEAPVTRLPRPVVPMVQQVGRRVPVKPWRWATMAAAVAIVGVLGFMARTVLPFHDFRTGIGEQRSLELPDGSVVYLNARSEAEVRFSHSGREIELKDGEAMFKVAPDSARPFEVRTRDAVIRALGTQFNVASGESGTQVAVLEGRVRVSPVDTSAGQAAALGVGEAAQIARKGQVRVSTKADLTSVGAWRQRRLVFVNAPLDEIVSQFNRFNRKPLRLEGVDASHRHYSGTFDADDPSALVAVLSKETDLGVLSGEKETVIRGR